MQFETARINDEPYVRITDVAQFVRRAAVQIRGAGVDSVADWITMLAETLDLMNLEPDCGIHPISLDLAREEP